MKRISSHLSLLQVLIHLGVWLTLSLLVWDYFNGHLSVNPIQGLEQRSGRIALTILMLSLACTPVFILTGWQEVLKRRRTLGLYAFMAAAFHLSIFLVLDYGLNWNLILEAVVGKRFIIVGAVAFSILLALALTSFRPSKVWLGRNWKRLHRLVYVAGILVIVHYGWARKGNLLRLQGDILKPLLYGMTLFILLILRLRPIRKYFQTHKFIRKS
jgi:sulfoxide reductase heme-binding subunit YedZ